MDLPTAYILSQKSVDVPKERATSVGYSGFIRVHLCSGVNFTNILRTSFTFEDHKIAKKTDSLTVLFVLLGFEHVKASLKHVDEI